MRGFHDNAGELHKDVDERIRKVNRKRLKKTVVALTMTAAVLVGSLFSGPDDITVYAIWRDVAPTPVEVTITDGHIDFTLGNGQTLIIEDLPIGASWVLSEDMPAGWEQLQDRGIATSGTLSLDPSSTLLVNRYATYATWAPTVTKQLEGRALEDAEFAFSLVDSEGTGILYGENDDAGTVNFTNVVEFDGDDHAAVQTFVLSEVEGDNSSIVYDVRPITYTVTATDNGDGTMTVVASPDREESFINYFHDVEMPMTGLLGMPTTTITIVIVLGIVGAGAFIAQGRSESRKRKTTK